jgi:hypothetical protein
MKLRVLFLVPALALLAMQARADTFDFSYSAIRYLCGPFVGGVPANLTVDALGFLTAAEIEVNGAVTAPVDI